MTITNQILQGVGADLGVPVIVTRAKPEVNALPLRVGERVTLCLAAFRVLPNFPLASERGGRMH